MSSRFTLRMQFDLNEDPERITARLLKLVRQAPVDEIMFFFFAEELNDGHDPLERIREWLERSRPYRKALAQAGVSISLNPWHSLLHLDRGRKLKPQQRWQTMADPNGRAAQAVVCPLDPQWRDYYAAAMRLYAQEGFRVIWIDDDIRYHNHDPLQWGGCFCPLHVAEFNRRAGTQATRDEIVAKCTAAGSPHPWRELWMDMWDDLHCKLISGWREIVAAGGSRLGLMSSLPEAHAAEGRRWENWWRALAGDEPPIHRPHYWGYSATGAASLCSSIAILDQNRCVQPEGIESGPEIECFPYGRWNKPFRQIGAQLALAHVLGANSLNISLYDFMGNDPDDEPQRVEFLRRWRPICDWLADEFPMTLQPVGVGVPWSQDMGRRLRTDGSGEWRSLTCPSRGWALWLGAAGHAFSMRPSPCVNALAGPVTWSFGDEQLRAWSSAGLLLDGEAASILVGRGLGELIGVREGRFIKHGEVLYSIERCTDAGFALREGAQISVNGWDHAARMFQADFLPGVRVVSELRGPTQKVVGHGVALYANELGGRIALVPWRALESPHAVMMNAQRAAQLTSLLAYLDPDNAHGWAEGGPWLTPQFLTDGRRCRGVVWNAGGDAVEEIRVHPPQGMTFTAAEQVTAQGERLPARLRAGRVILARPMHQWEFVVLL